MKILMNVLIFVLASFSFAACEKANYQVSPDSIDKPAENYSGTFEATYKNYKNFSTSVTITGSININVTSIAGNQIPQNDIAVVSASDRLTGFRC